MSYRLKILLAGIIPVMLTGLVQAQPAPARAVYAGLTAQSCQALTGKPRGDHDLVAYRCEAPGNRSALLEYHGVRVSLKLAPKGAAAHGAPVLVAPFDIGPRMEWRGRDVQGRFEPHAAIERLHARTADGRTESALAVLRVTGQTYCLLAIAAGAQANELARQAGDDMGRMCGSPQRMGAESAVADELLQLQLSGLAP